MQFNADFIEKWDKKLIIKPKRKLNKQSYSICSL